MGGEEEGEEEEEGEGAKMGWERKKFSFSKEKKIAHCALWTS